MSVLTVIASIRNYRLLSGIHGIFSSVHESACVRAQRLCAVLYSRVVLRAPVVSSGRSRRSVYSVGKHIGINAARHQLHLSLKHLTSARKPLFVLTPELTGKRTCQAFCCRSHPGLHYHLHRNLYAPAVKPSLRARFPQWG